MPCFQVLVIDVLPIAYSLPLFTFTTEILSPFHPTLIFLLTAHLEKIAVSHHYVLWSEREVFNGDQAERLFGKESTQMKMNLLLLFPFLTNTVLISFFFPKVVSI